MEGYKRSARERRGREGGEGERRLECSIAQESERGRERNN